MSLSISISSLFSQLRFYHCYYQSASSPFLLTISQSLHSGEWDPSFITFSFRYHNDDDSDDDDIDDDDVDDNDDDDDILPGLICSYEA